LYSIGVCAFYREGDADYAAVVSTDRYGNLRWRCYLEKPVEFLTLIGDARGKAYGVDGEKIYCIARSGDLL